MMVTVSRTGLTTPRRVWPYLAGIGALGNSTHVAYLLASRRGLLVLVAVDSSLYPVVTVLLARVVLQKRLARPQVLGLALAVLAVALNSVA